MVHVVSRRAGVRGPVAEVLVEHSDERAAHGVGLRAVHHEGADDLVVDLLRLADTKAPVLAAEVGLLPVVRQSADEAGGPLGEVGREQGVVLKHEQHATALPTAVEAVGQGLLEDADVAQHAAPGPAALSPPRRRADGAAVDRGEPVDAADGAVALERVPPLGAAVEVDAQGADLGAARRRGQHSQGLVLEPGRWRRILLYGRGDSPFDLFGEWRGREVAPATRPWRDGRGGGHSCVASHSRNGGGTCGTPTRRKNCSSVGVGTGVPSSL